MSAVVEQSPVNRLLERLVDVRSNDRGWMARCPGHSDARPSLSVMETTDGRVIINCFAGCRPEQVLDAIGLSFRDLRPPDPSREAWERTELTLSELAAAKGIPERFLERLGLRDSVNPYDGRRQVDIPYFNPDGSLIAVKRRTHQSAGRGSFWPKRTPPAVYGLSLLDMAREAGYLFIVEGESDLWTLVWHNIPALGLPGVRTAATLELSHLEGVRRVYISEEAGAGGEAFRTGVLARLRELHYRGARRVIAWPAEAKDPNAFYLSDPEHFVERLREMMKDADREARARRFVRYPTLLLGPALLAEEIACMAALLNMGRERDDGSFEVETTPEALARRGGFLDSRGADTVRCGEVLAGLIERGYVEIASGSERTVFLIRPEMWADTTEVRQ